MSYVKYEWITAHTNASWHVWVSRVTCMNESHHIHRWVISHRKHDRFMPHTRMSHVTYEWVMPHINESCHICMSHVTYECVMSHMNEACQIWMCHVTYEWVMPHMNESCHIWTGHVTCEWVTSHVNESLYMWMSYVTYECQIWMSHVTYRESRRHKESCAQSCHVQMSHVTYEWVVSHINESCHVWIRLVMHEWVMSHMNESIIVSRITQTQSGPQVCASYKNYRGAQSLVQNTCTYICV